MIDLAMAAGLFFVGSSTKEWAVKWLGVLYGAMNVLLLIAGGSSALIGAY